MKLIYGTNINATVDDNLAPEDIMATLKESYPELSQGTYAITGPEGDKVMTVTVRSGAKA